MTEPDRESHRWPACYWPGWALLYANLIRDLRVMDPDLFVDNVWDGGMLLIGHVVTSTEGDAVFDRIEKAERLAEISCVVCGELSDGSHGVWPPLCCDHVTSG